MYYLCLQGDTVVQQTVKCVQYSRARVCLCVCVYVEGQMFNPLGGGYNITCAIGGGVLVVNSVYIYNMW